MSRRKAENIAHRLYYDDEVYGTDCVCANAHVASRGRVDTDDISTTTLRRLDRYGLVSVEGDDVFSTELGCHVDVVIHH